MRSRPRTSIITLLVLAACVGGDAPATGPHVTRTTVGDTTVVRTDSGSEWGAPASLVKEVSIGEMDGAPEYLFGSVTGLAVAPDGTIYVLDRQGPELRAYDAQGAYVRTIGTKGEGPGELKQPDSGLTVLSDGRVVVRDPGNARLQVYGPDGAPAGAWRGRGGFFTSAPLWRDRDDNVYTQVLLNQGAAPGDWHMGLVRLADDGTPGDTLRPPDVGFEAPSIEAHSPDGRGISRNSVPFSPSERYAVHPDGYFIHGVSTTYRVELLEPGAPLILERAAPPVPVAAGEKEEAEARTTRNMQRTAPGWRWNGPAIPDTKPAFSELMVGADGRIWVQVAQPGVERDDPNYDPKDPDAVEQRWHEPVAFDVFEEDGTYLGQVHTPDGFSTNPRPVFDGDQVWAVVRDDLGVERVVRFRVEHTPESSS